MIMRAATVMLTVVLFAGCSTIGPPSVSRDRFDYNEAVSEDRNGPSLI